MDLICKKDVFLQRKLLTDSTCKTCYKAVQRYQDSIPMGRIDLENEIIKQTKDKKEKSEYSHI